MQTRRATIAALLLILPTAVFLLTRSERHTYTLQELSAPGCFDTRALAINNRREVAGWCAAASVPIRAIRWQNGVAATLGTLGGVRSHATGINDAGQIVGAADTRSGISHAVLWQHRRIHDLGTPSGPESEATAINLRGDVVGWAEAGKGRRHAVLWQNGHMRDLGTLGGMSSEATGINNRGQVVGWAQVPGAYRHAFLWEHGRMCDLGTLGGPQSEAHAINDRGQIVGFADTGSLARRAFRYSNGVMTDLYAGDDGYGDATAQGINSSGQIVGRCSGRHVDGDHGAETAFCLRAGRLELLCCLMPQAPDSLLQDAAGINDHGDIAANAVSGTQVHALLLIPH